jgi:outer membrane immunogenic protein
MKKILLMLAITSAPLMLPSIAFAADAIDPGPYDWSGIYAVGSAGAYNQSTDFFEDFFDHSFADDNLGAIVGGGLGYNLQQESLVFGLEADISFLTGHTSVYANTGDYVSDPDNWAAESEISTLGTLRGRVGYAAENVLLYITGGLAYGRVHNESSWPLYGDTSYDTDRKSWEVGWVVGAGAEAAITEHWSLRAEGLYVDLGNSKNDDEQGFTYGFDNTAIIGKVSAAFHF